MKLIQFVFAVPVIVLFGLLGCENVLAHATPTLYVPEASSIFELNQFPKEISITFTERIEPSASNIIVYAPDGSESAEKAVVDSSDPHILKANLRQAKGGTYAVSWQVVSADDGHFTKGGFVFSVGEETVVAGAVGSQAQVNIIHLSTYSEGLTIFIELLGQTLLIGVFGIFLFMRRYGKMISDKILSWSVVGGVALIIAGALSYFFANSSSLAGAQGIDFSRAVSNFAGTVAGEYALCRAVIALVILFVFWFTRKGMAREKLSAGEVVSIILLLVILYMRARVSHAAASHFYPALSIIVNFVHLIFKELWIGILLAIAIFWKEFKKSPDFNSRNLFINFSKVASMAIIVAGVTGFYVIWLHLKDPKYIFTTNWGSEFMKLNVAAVLFIGLRLFNQVLVEYKQWFAGLAKYTRGGELISGIFVLLFTSFLIITTPPVEQTVFERSVESQGAVVSILDHQAKHFQVDVKNKDGLPVRVNNIVITVVNNEKGIGPIVVPADKVSEGQYYIDQKYFSPSGNWRLEITAQRPDSYDAVASFDIDYPREIVSLAQIPERHFGSFEILSILGAVAVAIFFALLYKLSSGLLSQSFQ
jgi:methionine-rich copper-binding protein CopC/putative copper export protein